MNRIKFYLLFSFILGSLFVKGQNSVQVEIYPNRTITLDYEKFNLSSYQNKFAASGSLDYAYTEYDGTRIRVTCQRRGQPVEVYITPPAPAVHRIFKEFYPNGNLKQKGLYLPQQFRIGKWLQCDERGYCNVVNYDANKGSFGYNGLLKTLAEKGYINPSTGQGNWSFVVWFNDNSRQWGVKLQKNSQYKMFTINADTGEILTESEYEVKASNTTSYGTYISPEY